MTIYITYQYQSTYCHSREGGNPEKRQDPTFYETVRTIRLKNDKFARRGGKKTIHDNNYCPKGLGLFLFGLSPKRNKKNTLCALCASSEAGGESMSQH
jgi:hypothetical protein